MAGETEVRTNPELEQHYNVKYVTTGEQWKSKLKKAVVWIDYMCMPQPSATDDESGQDRATKASADHRQMEALDANGDGTVSGMRILLLYIPLPTSLHTTSSF